LQHNIRRRTFLHHPDNSELFPLSVDPSDEVLRGDM
jgi:hypothetical protein